MRMQNWSAAVCLAVLMAGAVHADVTGSILGVVRDQSSAAIVAARIRVTNVETNLSKETLSGTDGEFRVLALPAGTYRVEAVAPGFQQFVQTGVVVNVNDHYRVDITLEVGSTETKVSVEANSAQVETERSASRSRGVTRLSF